MASIPLARNFSTNSCRSSITRGPAFRGTRVPVHLLAEGPHDRPPDPHGSRPDRSRREPGGPAVALARARAHTTLDAAPCSAWSGRIVIAKPVDPTRRRFTSFTARRQQRPSSAANRNPPKPCTPPARWNGSSSRRNRAEPQCLSRRPYRSQQRAAGHETDLAVAGGPRVRIHLPPAERWYGAGGEGDGTIVAGK